MMCRRECCGIDLGDVRPCRRNEELNKPFERLVAIKRAMRSEVESGMSSGQLGGLRHIRTDARGGRSINQEREREDL